MIAGDACSIELAQAVLSCTILCTYPVGQVYIPGRQTDIKIHLLYTRCIYCNKLYASTIETQQELVTSRTWTVMKH